MKLELAAFTPRGEQLAEQLAEELTARGHQAAQTRDGCSAKEWTARAYDGRSRFSTGETVVIRAVEGVKLMVSKLQD